MSGFYSEEYNRTFPDQPEGPEYTPYVNSGSGTKPSISKSTLAALVAAAAMTAALFSSDFDVDNIQTHSAIFEYEVKSDAEDLLTYELISGGETVQEGFLDLGDDDLLFDDLTPDTRYSVKIFKNRELLDTIHFRTKPADGNSGPEYTAPVPTGTSAEPSSGSTSEPTAESTVETTEEVTEMTTEETTEETTEATEETKPKKKPSYKPSKPKPRPTVTTEPIDESTEYTDPSTEPTKEYEDTPDNPEGGGDDIDNPEGGGDDIDNPEGGGDNPENTEGGGDTPENTEGGGDTPENTEGGNNTAGGGNLMPPEDDIIVPEGTSVQFSVRNLFSFLMTAIRL